MLRVATSLAPPVDVVTIHVNKPALLRVLTFKRSAMAISDSSHSQPILTGPPYKNECLEKSWQSQETPCPISQFQVSPISTIDFPICSRLSMRS